MSDPCSCPVAGWCERHQRTKTPHLHSVCQTKEVYRANWDKLADAQQAVRYSSQPCIYRGEVLRQVECDLCGQRGTLKDVYACEKMGECTERKTGTYPIVASCFGCPSKAVSVDR